MRKRAVKDRALASSNGMTHIIEPQIGVVQGHSSGPPVLVAAASSAAAAGPAAAAAAGPGLTSGSLPLAAAATPAAAAEAPTAPHKRNAAVKSAAQSSSTCLQKLLRTALMRSKSPLARAIDPPAALMRAAACQRLPKAQGCRRCLQVTPPSLQWRFQFTCYSPRVDGQGTETTLASAYGCPCRRQQSFGGAMMM